jgi:hypothetical protein
MIKVVTFFLIFMLVLAMFGRLRFPGHKARAAKAKRVGKCPSCGSYMIGNTPCSCGHKGG